MPNEIAFDAKSGLTFFAYRFQPNGDVLLSDGASDEVWGLGGRDADDYDIPVTESGDSGHYVGDFDPGASGNIAAGRYKVAVCKQAGGNPADTDLPARYFGGILWDGSSEIFGADEDDITTAHATTDALVTILTGYVQGVLNIYDERT